MADSAQPVLALIDGMALVYRGHFAMMRNPRMTTTGINASSLQVFLNVMHGVKTDSQAIHWRSSSTPGARLSP